MIQFRTCLVALALAAAVVPVGAQGLLERTPNLPNSVQALPGMLEHAVTHRFASVGGAIGLQLSPTFDFALGVPWLLPGRWTGGVRFAPVSDVVPDETDEWEFYSRIGLLRQAAGAPLDVMVTGAYNAAAGSVDGEALLGRRIGPLRLLAGARLLAEPFGGAELRTALAGGVVWQPAPRRMPLTVAADVASLLDRTTAEDVAWSAGVQLGLPYTALVLSLQASNASTTTLAGTSLGSSRTRYGVGLDVPVEFIGFVFGWYAPREVTMRAVQGEIEGMPAARVRIAGYLFAPATVRVRAGDVVEWRNDDDMVHTVAAENGAFDSHAIRPGQSWRARFDEPGMFPYYCGPHPFMKGVVVVVPR
ncbi:MAG TPA: cupredoxin family copper-binding protein [Longimicrobiales bacterium]|nr:cupredoxin family copper-binding protein [Longimicrobiales bacterium]